MVTPPDMPAAHTPPVNPFDSELAIQHSQYFYTKDGLPVSRGGPASPPDLFASAAVAAFRGFVQNPQFSCVGAKSAVAQESARLGVYDHLGSAEATAGLARDLWTFTHDTDTDSDNDYVTFVALFKGPTELDEAGFEDHLWEQLRQLNRLDAPLHTGTRPSVRTRTTRTSGSASPAPPFSSSACTRTARGRPAASPGRCWCSTRTPSSPACGRPGGGRGCKT